MSGGLSQQGQVDWVALGNSVFSSSFMILQRFADAGIQPITHQAGLAISTQFQLGEMGSRRVRDALGNVRVYHGFESVLWFGFGHKSFLALLTEQELGVNCAALCACLGETYGSARASQLLQALWKTNDFPNDLEPSRDQFQALVSSCSGLLLSTPFADVLRRMAGPYKENGRGIVFISPAASKDLAKALNALFQVSRGVLRAIEVHGGHDIAFLAAVAHWLFDLSLWVQMDEETTLFNSCVCPEQASVRLYYADVNIPQNSLIRISATTFVLRSVQDLITDDPYSPITFRISWDVCLSHLFNFELEDVLCQAALLGKALGSVARIYEAIATCEVDVGELSRAHFINFQPRGYGRSFVDSICALMPEIGSNGAFLEGAKTNLRQSVAENVSALQELVEKLRANCPCKICANNPANISREKSCNVAVLLFLRHIGDIMAHVDSDPLMNPTETGLGDALVMQIVTWKEFQIGRRSLIGMIMGVPHVSDSPAGVTRFARIPQPFHLDYVLDQVSRLFIGQSHHSEFNDRPMHRDKAQCTALSKAGVCVWLDALRSVNTNPGSMSTVHVVPGQIACKKRNYASVWDLTPASTNYIPEMPNVVFSPSESFAIMPMQASGLGLSLKGLATERGVEGTIGFAYQVTRVSPTRYLQPVILTEELIVSTARFPCSKSATCANDISVPFYLRRSGWDFGNYGLDPKQEKICFNDDGAFLL